MTSYLKVFWFMLLNFHHILQHLTEVSGEVLLTQVKSEMRMDVHVALPTIHHVWLRYDSAR